MLTQALAKFTPGDDEEPLEVTEEGPQFAVGVVVRLPDSTIGIDRSPATPTSDVAEEIPSNDRRCPVDLQPRKG
eukprot:8373167-Lingulodinium_polyedra.AAC.1